MILFFNILALGFLTLVGTASIALLILRCMMPVTIKLHWWVLPGTFVSLAWLFAQWVQS